MILCNGDIIFYDSVFSYDLKSVVVLTGAKLYGKDVCENLTIEVGGLSQYALGKQSVIVHTKLY
jgi:hypothetical protein